MLTPGIRVIRGLDWVWKDQDGGPGGVGTVSEIGMPGSKNLPDKTVFVNWDCGIRSNYRVGYQGLYDLLILDNAQSGVRHPSMECDSCKQNPIIGIRYKCLECYDFDLCSLCYHSEKHDTKHPFARYDNAASQGVKLSPRAGEPRLCVKGVFAGAVVARGHDWKWDSQDGGPGGTGTVTKVTNWDIESQRSVACVTWHSGYKNDYRVGHKGLMDLKCVTPSIGGYYYVNHLPVLGKKYDPVPGAALETPPPPPIGKFRTGQRVRVLLDVDTLKSIQQGHGGWNPRMIEYIGKVGVVHRTTERGDVRVQYEGCPNRWTFHPGALELADPLISKQDIVQFSYNQPDKQKVNVRNARVLEILPDGNAKIQILKENTVLTLPISALRLVKAYEEVSSERPMESERKVGSESTPSAVEQPELKLLMSKVAQGDLQYLLQVKEKDPALLDTSYCGKTAVQVAAYQGHAALVRALLESGARPAAPDDDGDTALHDAAFGNQPEILELLLAHPDVDINMRNRSKCTALHIAAHKCLPHCVAVLLKNKADVNVQDAYGDTPLHDAVNAVSDSREPPTSAEDNVPVSAAQRIIKMLCDVPNVDLYCRNKRGFNVLQHAALKGAWAACSVCVTACPALVHVPKDDGFMPLHLAALNGHAYAVHALVVVGNADLNVRNNRQQTSLLLALSQGHVMVTELLVTLGCDVTLCDEDGNTALHIAVLKRGNIITNHEAVGNKFGAKTCPTIWKIYEKLSDRNLGENRIVVAVLLYLVQKGNDVEAKNKDDKMFYQLFDKQELGQSINELIMTSLMELTSNESEQEVESTLAEISLNDGNQNSTNTTRPNSMRETAFSGVRDNSNSSPYRTINYNLNELGSCSNSPLRKPQPQPIPQNNKSECVVCCESTEENCQFEPCGHKIACEDCAARMKKCLTCFTIIERRLSRDGRVLTTKRAPSAERLRYLETKIQEIEDTQCCSICMERRRSVAFLCGHTACGHCARTLNTCHMCRQPIQAKINLY